jgi:putative membrane protein
MSAESAEAWLPAANATLIVLSGLALLAGYGFIRSGRVQWHKRMMLTACVFAALFLVVYVTRAIVLPTKFFPGEGWLRIIYFTILVSHTIIAVLVAPFAFVTLRRALSGQFARHRKIARITLPMWAYTATTGWLVYFLLYHVA